MSIATLYHNGQGALVHGFPSSSRGLFKYFFRCFATDSALGEGDALTVVLAAFSEQIHMHIKEPLYQSYFLIPRKEDTPPAPL